MTTFDRFERSIPSLMDELAPARVPDYVDDLLRTTARMPQRPWWSALERWIPMGVIARTSQAPRVPWRYLAIAAALLILASAALIYVGSHVRALPPPYGPARNGVIVYGAANGDVVAFDPATNTSRTLIEGSADERYPLFTNDGSHLVFARTPDADHEVDFIANADGSAVRDLLPLGSTIKWFEWSATGEQALVTREVDGVMTTFLADAATGQVTSIDLDPALGITLATYRPGHDEILYEHVPADGQAGTKVYVGRSDGSVPLRPLALSPDAVFEAWPSPDGRKLVYSTWGTDESSQGRIHVLDLDNGDDQPLMFEGSAGHVEVNPQFSPDGRSIVLTRLDADGFRVTIVPADGNGPVTPVGPPYPAGSGTPDLTWSPDGTSVLAGYPDGTVRLLPVDGRPGRTMTGMAWDRGITWQRLAP